MTPSKYLTKPFKLGSKTLPNNIFYAPLAGCSDKPFRQMSAKYSPGLMYCEMVHMDALIRKIPTTYRTLSYSPEMHPIGGQICGSKPAIAGEAARIIQDLGFDVVDLNCGCPVDKVIKDGSGSGMLKTPHLIGETIANMVAAVNIPVTVKIRAGWDHEHINAEEITRIAEQAGAQAICIHGRTRQQGYKGPANWDYIKACKKAATRIKVIANGDIFSADAALRIFEHTGCDAILVARGTMGHPWIAQDIMNHLEGNPPITRTLEDCRRALLDHFLFTLDYHQNDIKKIVMDMRRVGCWYLKNAAGTKAFRTIMAKAISPEHIQDLILNFPLGDAFVADGEEEVEVSSEEECCA